MTRIIAAAALCAVLAGCAETLTTGSVSSGPRARVVLLPAEIKIVETAVSNDLIDPESARFRNVVAGRTPGGSTVVCGWVNAKNRFGGYVGIQPFAGELVGQRFNVHYVAKDYLVRPQIQAICGDMDDYTYGPKA